MEPQRLPTVSLMVAVSGTGSAVRLASETGRTTMTTLQQQAITYLGATLCPCIQWMGPTSVRLSAYQSPLLVTCDAAAPKQPGAVAHDAASCSIPSRARRGLSSPFLAPFGEGEGGRTATAALRPHESPGQASTPLAALHTHPDSRATDRHLVDNFGLDVARWAAELCYYCCCCFFLRSCQAQVSRATTAGVRIGVSDAPVVWCRRQMAGRPDRGRWRATVQVPYRPMPRRLAFAQLLFSSLSRPSVRLPRLASRCVLVLSRCWLLNTRYP